MNSKTTWMKFPIWITGAPAFFAASRLTYRVPLSVMNIVLKSTLPSNGPRGAMTTSLTIEFTILPKAPPMITPMARSTMLPRMANFRNSWRKPLPRSSVGSSLSGMSCLTCLIITLLSFEQCLEVGGQFVDVGFGGVPGAHEAAAALTNEIVKHPAAVPEGINDLTLQFDEDGVRLAREKDFHFGQIADGLLEVFGHRIGVAGVPQPCAILQHTNPGSGEKAHLRSELAGLLATVIEFFGEFGIEEHDSIADGSPVFCAAEAEDVNA